MSSEISFIDSNVAAHAAQLILPLSVKPLPLPNCFRISRGVLSSPCCPHGSSSVSFSHTFVSRCSGLEAKGTRRRSLYTFFSFFLRLLFCMCRLCLINGEVHWDIKKVEILTQRLVQSIQCCRRFAKLFFSRAAMRAFSELSEDC